MRFVRHSFTMALIGGIVSALPLAASAAWNAEDGGPHREHRVDAPPTGTPAEPRSMAPKPGVAMERPVSPSPGEPPVGSRSLAPKKGVAFQRPVGPGSAGSSPEMPLVSD